MNSNYLLAKINYFKNSISRNPAYNFFFFYFLIFFLFYCCCYFNIDNWTPFVYCWWQENCISLIGIDLIWSVAHIHTTWPVCFDCMQILSLLFVLFYEASAILSRFLSFRMELTRTNTLSLKVRACVLTHFYVMLLAMPRETAQVY